jgi:hypothetical protein
MSNANISYEEILFQKLNDVKQHQVKISNRIAPLENLDENVDINRAWKGIRENKNFSHRKSKILQIYLA